MRKKRVPKKLQGVLWSVDVSQLDLEEDMGYIIHQIFAYGTMNEIRWVFNTYPKEKIIRTFTTCPYKDYFAPRFYFVKKYLLDLKDYPMNEKRYVKNIPRDIR